MLTAPPPAPIHLPVYLPHRSCEPRQRLALASSPSPQRSTIDLQDTQSHLQQTPFPTTKKQAGALGPKNHRKNISSEKAFLVAKNI